MGTGSYSAADSRKEDLMRIIDVDGMMEDINNSLERMTKMNIAVDGGWLWYTLNDAVNNAPTIKTKQIKYFDEDEKVWKIGSVIVDENVE